MKLFKFILSICLCLAISEAKAQYCETLVLKPYGDIYDGYISEQDFKKGTIEFTCTDTVVTGIKTSDILSKYITIRQDNNEPGLLDVVYQDTVFFTGQIHRVIPGKEYRMMCEDGSEEILASSKVSKLCKIAVREDVSIFKQSPFLDIIVMKGNVEGEFEGIITTQSYTSGEKSVLEMKNGGVMKFNMNDLVLYKKIPNPDYRGE